MFGDQDELEAFNKQKAGKGLEENDMWVNGLKFNMFNSLFAYLRYLFSAGQVMK